MSLLTGRFPRETTASGRFTLTALKLPQQLPVSLPSSLVAQRPDVQAQEAKLHEASASIGVATANLLPQLTISASGGNEALAFDQLWHSGSGIWSLTAGLTQPLFEGGTLRAKRRAAIDRYDQALALYQLTVLTAFQNVADALTALLHDAEAVQAQSAAYDAAKASFDLVRRQYEAGATSYVDLLTAQRTYEQARLAEIRIIATRYLDTVTLFQALGGGWIRHDIGRHP
jgi:NodT family efflux transporter outer membrane factor (OMF) lipoprotein